MRTILLALLLAVPAAAADPAPAPACDARPEGRRDILWAIVSRCLDASAAGYCDACPSPRPGTCGDRDCRSSLETWDESDPELVVIRDRKMCGCPEGFVHGLAMPRARTCGVEDARRRPARIWSYAWRMGEARVPDRENLALAANPLNARSQDQLHVHVLRLAPGARERLLAQRPRPARVASLDEAWAAAARSAPDGGLESGDYGVIAVADGDGFLVAAVRGSPEAIYTIAECR